MNSASLVYTYPWRSYFIAKDIDALRKSHRVYEHAFNSRSPYLLPWDFIRQLVFLISARLRGARVAIVHFAGHHSVLPVLLGFRTFIVVAGSDSCSFPGIRYGSFRKRGMTTSMSISMRKAAAILPVHASLERFANTYSEVGPLQQGYAHFIPGLVTPSIEISYGFDIEYWRPQGGARDPNTVLCIATAASNGNAIHYRKGIDLLMLAAQQLPNVDFTVIGTNDRSYTDTPANIRFLGMVPPKALKELLASNSIYAQPSIMEGFPNALCEAMLMGCIPIGSNITSIPDLIGDAGEILMERDAMHLTSAIKKILGSTEAELNERRIRARKRIIGYTMEARITRLEEIIGPEDQRR